MNSITVLAFDLSTACVGVVAAVVDKDTKQPTLVKSCPIIPKKFSPEQLGYKKSKKKLNKLEDKFIKDFTNQEYDDFETFEEEVINCHGDGDRRFDF